MPAVGDSKSRCCGGSGCQCPAGSRQTPAAESRGVLCPSPLFVQHVLASGRMLSVPQKKGLVKEVGPKPAGRSSCLLSEASWSINDDLQQNSMPACCC